MKNDKARKEWLAGLRDGDRVIRLNSDDELPLSEHVLSGCDNSELQSGRRYWSRKNGREVGEDRSLIAPATPELRARVLLRGLGTTIEGMTQMVRFTDAQVIAVASILWPEEFK